MRYYYDLIRWRFVAMFYIGWWICKCMPMEDMPPYRTRWETIKWAYKTHRMTIMYPHEKDDKSKWRTLDEIIAELREQDRIATEAYHSGNFKTTTQLLKDLESKAQ